MPAPLVDLPTAPRDLKQLTIRLVYFYDNGPSVMCMSVEALSIVDLLKP